MLDRHGYAVTCQVSEIGRMAIDTADTAGREHDFFCTDFFKSSVCHTKDAAIANIICADNIYKCGIFHDLDILTFSRLCQKVTRDLFSGHILMEDDTFGTVRALSGIKQVAIPHPF